MTHSSGTRDDVSTRSSVSKVLRATTRSILLFSEIVLTGQYRSFRHEKKGKTLDAPELESGTSRILHQC